MRVELQLTTGPRANEGRPRSFYLRPRLGARWESADAAAVLEERPERPSRNTRDAARPALGEVLRLRVMIGALELSRGSRVLSLVANQISRGANHIGKTCSGA